MAEQGLSLEELLALPVMVDIVTAGKALRISRDLAYDLAQRDEFPVRTVKIGRLYRVPRAELFRVLGVENPHHTSDAVSTPKEE